MEDFIKKMQDKCGIDRATADKVVAFMKDHAEDVTKFVADHGVLDRLPGGLGHKLSGLF